MRRSEHLRRQLHHQRRLPDEHDSSIVTDVKQIRSTIPAVTNSRNNSDLGVGCENSTNHSPNLDSAASANSSYMLYRPPDDESFEVSGDVSPSLYLSS